MRIEHRQLIAAPVERVWELTVDIESWPSITPTMTSVDRTDTGPLGVGSAAKVKQPAQRPRVWTVTAFEPGRVFTWQAASKAVTMTATHRLEASGDGTMNTLIVDVDGPLAPLLGLFGKRAILKAITTENAGFKRAAEG